MRSLLILSYNKPKHLHVTLDSIYKMEGIEKWVVAVSNDFQEDPDIDAEINETLAHFPIHRVYRCCRNKGILDHLTDSISYEFSSGATEVIFLEDDFILRSDTLQYADSIGREEFMVCLSGGVDRVVGHYRPKGNLITRKNFIELLHWIKCRRYVGLEHKIRYIDREPEGTGYIFDMKHSNHDAVYAIFVDRKRKMVRFPSTFYVAHFGITGIHRDTEEGRAIEAKVFSGDRTEWLPNMLSVLKNREQYSPVVQRRLWPEEFEYK